MNERPSTDPVALNEAGSRKLVANIFGISSNRVDPAVCSILATLLDTLPAREKEVLLRRYTLVDGKCTPLRACALMVSWGPRSSERIRQMEAHGLRVLRHPSRSRLLASYLLPIPSVVE